MAHLLLSVIGAVAQFERDLIRERQRDTHCAGEAAQCVSRPGSQSFCGTGR